MRIQCCWLLLICFGIACKKSVGKSQPATTSDKFSRGTNLSNWFNSYSDPNQYSNRFTANTLALIKSSGFTYVRLPIGSSVLYNESNPSQLNAGNLSLVDAAVSHCIAAGLAVTIDLHSDQSNRMDSLLAADPTYADKIAAYWKSLATFFKKYDSAQIAFEVYNEPHASAAGLTTQSFNWWGSVQEKLVKAIREVTNTHKILVGGEGWNSINGLVQLPVYNYPNIVYVFHIYDPFLFTHQGATWTGWQPAMLARNVPYPATPEGVAPLVAAASSTELKDALTWYGSQRYNIDSLDKWIKVAYDWGKSRNVKVIVNEFGSYKTYAPRQSRLNLIGDMRKTFDKYNIGWAMWDCDEGFGWIDYTGGNRNSPVADAGVLQALGL
ncbi:MAG: cellulase family glycosylhydrolase [Bacteroidota bacterium]|nr:cellulase family glycosylhydrolase [Bacteroidota bacterium]